LYKNKFEFFIFLFHSSVLTTNSSVGASVVVSVRLDISKSFESDIAFILAHAHQLVHQFAVVLKYATHVVVVNASCITKSLFVGSTLTINLVFTEASGRLVQFAFAQYFQFVTTVFKLIAFKTVNHKFCFRSNDSCKFVIVSIHCSQV
jgi:hypothetical protein